MAKKTIPKEPETKKGVWKPFLVLIKEAGLPYIAILVVIAVSLLHTRLQLIFPQATARIVAGDFSGGAIATMLAILFAQALMLAVREFVRAVARAKVTLRFRKFMVRKTLSLPVPYYDRNMADRLISRTTVDTTMLSSFSAAASPICRPSWSALSARW